MPFLQVKWGLLEKLQGYSPRARRSHNLKSSLCPEPPAPAQDSFLLAITPVPTPPGLQKSGYPQGSREPLVFASSLAWSLLPPFSWTLWSNLSWCQARRQSQVSTSGAGVGAQETSVRLGHSLWECLGGVKVYRATHCLSKPMTGKQEGRKSVSFPLWLSRLPGNLQPGFGLLAGLRYLG